MKIQKRVVDPSLIGTTDIVIGTGLEASILGARLARGGRKVLQTDGNRYYGESYGPARCDPPPPFPVDGLAMVILSSGPFVSRLLEDEVAPYLEFKPVDSTWVAVDGVTERVPASKSDVFTSTSLTLLEKRAISRFFADVKDRTGQGSRDRTLFDVLTTDFKFSCRLADIMVVAVALGSGRDMSELDGRAAILSYMSSIGRYGQTPFLAPVFGSGEWAQAYARQCAVLGGTQILGWENGGEFGDEPEGAAVHRPQPQALVHRLALAFESQNEELCTLVILDDGRVVYGLRLTHAAQACKPGNVVWHFTSDHEVDLQVALRSIPFDSGSQPIWTGRWLCQAHCPALTADQINQKI